MEPGKSLFVLLARVGCRKEDCMEKENGTAVEMDIYSGVKKDCFAYGSINNKCSILLETYCKNGNCKFYKTKREFEKGLKR